MASLDSLYTRDCPTAKAVLAELNNTAENIEVRPSSNGNGIQDFRIQGKLIESPSFNTSQDNAV
jgi:hypothetical protein